MKQRTWTSKNYFTQNNSLLFFIFLFIISVFQQVKRCVFKDLPTCRFLNTRNFAISAWEKLNFASVDMARLHISKSHIPNATYHVVLTVCVKNLVVIVQCSLHAKIMSNVQQTHLQDAFNAQTIQKLLAILRFVLYYQDVEDRPQ